MAQALVAQLPPASPSIQLLQEQLGEVNHSIYKNMAGPWIFDSGLFPGALFYDGVIIVIIVTTAVIGVSYRISWWCRAVLVWMHWDKFWSLPVLRTLDR